MRKSYRRRASSRWRARKAYRGRYRKTYRARRYSRVTRMRRQPIGVPKQKLITLRWSGSYTLDPHKTNPDQSFAGFNFQANGCCFNNSTFTNNHLPAGWNTWASMYNQYVVVGSKITATFIPANNCWTAGAYFGVFLDTNKDTSTIKNTDDLVESGMFKYRTVGPYGYVNLSSYFPNPITEPEYDTQNYREMKPVSVSMGFSAKRFFNIKNSRDLGALLANVNANPSADAHFWVGLANINNQQSSSVWQSDWLPAGMIRLVIDYVVLFKTPREKMGVFSTAAVDEPVTDPIDLPGEDSVALTEPMVFAPNVPVE